jgi:outer membrane protein
MSVNLRRFSLALMLATVTHGGGVPAVAADTPASGQPLVLMVVDTQRVLQESKAGKAIQSQMQGQVANYQKSLARQEEELSTAQQDLQRQQSILAQDAFAVKVKEFDQRFNDARKRAQEAQQSLSESQREAIGKVESTMVQVVTELAKERGANLILNNSAVVIFDVNLDVSAEVLKRLDAKLPALTVNFKSSSGATPASGATATKPAAPVKKR